MSMFAGIKRVLDLIAHNVLPTFGIDGHKPQNDPAAKQATPKML